MKAYIGNKVVCLAQPVEKEDQDGYDVLYPDGSETWLVKEIFDFEFRPMDDEEVQMLITTVIDTELTEEQMKEIFMDVGEDMYIADQETLKSYAENPEDFEVTDEINIPMEDLGKMIEHFEEEVKDAE